jgi:hypothetical protein
MKLSRKRTKELKRLRSSAEDLWQEQQEVLEHASTVLKQASKQANLLTHEHVLPYAASTYESRLKPSLDRGRLLATGARTKLATGVVPAVSGVAASALSVLDLAKNAGGKAFFKAPEPPKKTGPGAGTIALIVLGVVALAGVAYAAWQTFRADDDLWIADDEPEATGSTNPTDVPKTPTA